MSFNLNTDAILQVTKTMDHQAQVPALFKDKEIQTLQDTGARHNHIAGDNCHHLKARPSLHTLHHTITVIY